MRILWLCRWFGNYRIPLYKKLNQITDNEFFMIYSRDSVSESVNKGMLDALGDNAIALEKERHIIIGNPDSNFANSYIDIPYQKGLLSTIEKINPDVIISDGFFQWTFAAALKSRKRKLVVFYERTAYVERNASWYRNLFRKFMGNFIDGFCINGSLTREYLNQLGFGNKPMVEGCMVADSTKLKTDVENCTKDDITNLKREQCIEENGLTYLFVGQLVERKGIKELTTAWKGHVKKYESDTLLVIGEGVLAEELKESCNEIKSIKFLGQVPYETIHLYYAVADVSIMPTLEDNWSLVVPESMACRLPIATTIYNGCHVELVKDGENGFAFDPHDMREIMDTLEKFHSSDLVSMGNKSQQIASHYTPDIAAEKIYKLCKKLEK